MIRIVSFGYLHLGDEPPPAADHVEDLRSQISDPAGYRLMLAMLEHGPVDGRSEAVQQLVLSRPSAVDLLHRLVAQVHAAGLASLALGCGQGHDRSVAMAEMAAAMLRDDGRQVVLEHRHVDLPRIR